MSAAAATTAPLTVFVTGTDTGVGKTRVSVELVLAARAAGLRACGYKPVASGSTRTDQGLRNDDAQALQRVSSGRLQYQQINVYSLEPPIAPHLAAKAAGLRMDAAPMDAAHEALAATHDLVVVEGAGGWRVPLNDTLSFDDWVTARGWPVLLVVGMRLGCINHALLSADAIRRGGQLLGWVANTLPPVMPELQANLQSISTRIGAPLLGTLGAHEAKGGAAGARLWQALLERRSGIAAHATLR